MMGEDAHGLVHWVPIMRWAACGKRVEPSRRPFPTCLFCMARFSERWDRREHACDGELLR